MAAKEIIEKEMNISLLVISFGFGFGFVLRAKGLAKFRSETTVKY
jgi:hypothetical protein